MTNPVLFQVLSRFSLGNRRIAEPFCRFPYYKCSMHTTRLSRGDSNFFGKILERRIPLPLRGIPLTKRGTLRGIKRLLILLLRES